MTVNDAIRQTAEPFDRRRPGLPVPQPDNRVALQRNTFRQIELQFRVFQPKVKFWFFTNLQHFTVCRKLQILIFSAKKNHQIDSTKLQTKHTVRTANSWRFHIHQLQELKNLETCEILGITFFLLKMTAFSKESPARPAARTRRSVLRQVPFGGVSINVMHHAFS